jgi:post-segregation antitoxin (ccd killing protein)
MRMARVNITVPDDLYDQARTAGLNVSQLTRQAIADELGRRAKIAELDAYLAELDKALGPTTETERAEAVTWADEVLGDEPGRRSA